MSFQSKNIRRIAEAMHEDVEGIIARRVELRSFTEGADFWKINVKHGSRLDFTVDYSGSLYRLGDSELWKKFELPYWERHEFFDYVREHLTSVANEFGENKLMRSLLLRGGSRALKAMAERLKLEGDGRLAALTVDEIMENAVQAAVHESKSELEASPWARRILRNAWRELAELCVKGIYGREYRRAMQAERNDQRWKRAVQGGKLVGGLSSLALVAIAFL